LRQRQQRRVLDTVASPTDTDTRDFTLGPFSSLLYEAISGPRTVPVPVAKVLVSNPIL
jgi:hypothetical protein